MLIRYTSTVTERRINVDAGSSEPGRLMLGLADWSSVPLVRNGKRGPSGLSIRGPAEALIFMESASEELDRFRDSPELFDGKAPVEIGIDSEHGVDHRAGSRDGWLDLYQDMSLECPEMDLDRMHVLGIKCGGRVAYFPASGSPGFHAAEIFACVLRDAAMYHYNDAGSFCEEFRYGAEGLDAWRHIEQTAVRIWHVTGVSAGTLLESMTSGKTIVSAGGLRVPSYCWEDEEGISEWLYGQTIGERDVEEMAGFLEGGK